MPPCSHLIDLWQTSHPLVTKKWATRGVHRAYPMLLKYLKVQWASALKTQVKPKCNPSPSRIALTIQQENIPPRPHKERQEVIDRMTVLEDDKLISTFNWIEPNHKTLTSLTSTITTARDAKLMIFQPVRFVNCRITTITVFLKS